MVDNSIDRLLIDWKLTKNPSSGIPNILQCTSFFPWVLKRCHTSSLSTTAIKFLNRVFKFGWGWGCWDKYAFTLFSKECLLNPRPNLFSLFRSIIISRSVLDTIVSFLDGGWASTWYFRDGAHATDAKNIKFGEWDDCGEFSILSFSSWSSFTSFSDSLSSSLLYVLGIPFFSIFSCFLTQLLLEPFRLHKIQQY